MHAKHTCTHLHFNLGVCVSVFFKQTLKVIRNCISVQKYTGGGGAARVVRDASEDTATPAAKRAHTKKTREHGGEHALENWSHILVLSLKRRAIVIDLDSTLPSPT